MPIEGVVTVEIVEGAHGLDGQTSIRLLIFFRIDRHATGRVLTLMLASEW